MITTPDLLAQDIADAYDEAMAVTTQLPDVLVSSVHEDGDAAVFYVDTHNPGEGNQRFSVVITECTDIRE